MINSKPIESNIVIVFLVLLLGVILIFSDPSNRTLLIGSAGMFLLLLSFKPEKALLGYLVIVPLIDQLIPFFSGFSPSGARLGPQIILRGGLIVLLVFYRMINHKNSAKVKAVLPMTAVICLIVASTLISNFLVTKGLTTAAKLAFWMLLLPVIADMVKQGKMSLNAIYWCVVISALIFAVSLLGAPILFGELAFYGRSDLRLQGLFNISSVSISLSIALMVVVTLAIKQRSNSLVLLLSALGVVFIIGIMRTYSRTAFVATAVGFLMLNLMLWLYGKGENLHRHKIVLGAIWVIVAGAIAIYIIYSATDIEAVKDRLFGDLSDYDKAGSGRLLLYSSALNTYNDYSIFEKIIGRGFGLAFWFLPEDSPKYGESHPTHNDYLAILLAGGVVGLGLYLWIFVSLWKQIKPTFQNDYWPGLIAGAAIAVYLSSAMTGVTMYNVSAMSYFSFLVGGAIGYYMRPCEEKNVVIPMNERSRAAFQLNSRVQRNAP